MLELNTQDAILAQNKLLTQQVEALTEQMAKLPQQLQAIQTALPVTYQNVPTVCEACGWKLSSAEYRRRRGAIYGSSKQAS